jgi:hypothetical protein
MSSPTGIRPALLDLAALAAMLQFVCAHGGRLLLDMRLINDVDAVDNGYDDTSAKAYRRAVNDKILYFLFYSLRPLLFLA